MTPSVRMWRPCWNSRGRPNRRGSEITSWNSGGCAPLPDFSKGPGLHRPEHQPDCQEGERRRPRLSGRHGGDPGEIGADKFLRGHEGEIILFEAAARELKRLDAVPLPATQRLRAEMDELTARKATLQSEYRKAQQKEREYDTLSQNVSMLLEQPKDIVLPKEKTNELE